MKKPGFFNRSTETVYEGTEAKCTVDNLEQWTEYVFQVRCGYDGDWSKWSERVMMKTQIGNSQIVLALIMLRRK